MEQAASSSMTRSHKHNLANGEADPSTKDFMGSSLAAVARSALIQKLVMLPKLKAAAFFQPEDHVQQMKNKPEAKIWRMFYKTLTFGSIFTSGCAMFVTHDIVLHYLAHGEDMDTTSATKSAIAGAAGGTVYALLATPVTAFVRAGARNFFPLMGGLLYTIPRDAGGYALYFGAYTFVRGLELDLRSDVMLAQKVSHAESFWNDFAMDITIAGIAGAAAGMFSYLWRSPWDALYKKQYGWRPANALLFDPNRFITSPRGLNAIGVGAATWMVYEAAMRGLHELHKYGQALEAEEKSQGPMVSPMFRGISPEGEGNDKGT
jgi:hypothetical protein